jgi:hypothetical protein
VVLVKETDSILNYGSLAKLLKVQIHYKHVSVELEMLHPVLLHAQVVLFVCLLVWFILFFYLDLNCFLQELLAREVFFWKK